MEETNRYFYAVMETPFTKDYIFKHGITAEPYSENNCIPLATDGQTAAQLLVGYCANMSIIPDVIQALIFPVNIPASVSLEEGHIDSITDGDLWAYNGTIPPEYIAAPEYATIQIKTVSGQDGT